MHSFESALVKTPEGLKTPPSGVFSILKRHYGESLITTLFRTGIINYSDKEGPVVNKEALKNLPKHNQRILTAALIYMSPQNAVSLDPHSLYVEFIDKDRLLIKRIVPIELKNDVDVLYAPCDSLERYIELAQTIIQLHLKNRVLLPTDLVSLNDIYPMYLKKLHIFNTLLFRLVSQYDNSPSPNLEDLLNWQFPNGKRPTFKINGETTSSPKTVFELVATYSDIHTKITELEQSGAENFTITIDGSSYTVKLPAFGQGDRGVVFVLKGQNDVLKLPKSTIKSVSVLFDEARSAKFWSLKAKQTKLFEVPARRFSHPFGLYAVLEKNDGETLTATLIRLKLLNFDPSTNKSWLNIENLDIENNPSHKTLSDAIIGISEIMRDNPDMALSISPNNLHVNYLDEAKTIIDTVHLIDVGLSHGKNKYKGVYSFEDYLISIPDRLEKYLNKPGYAPKEFVDIQNRASRLVGHSVS
ncbi:MAG: hypothetical protein ISR65_01580, partial [Bacteriovoracaceae bacterium]|nr:hypothetical protein [Bacteriovoracaceae bacterium]